MGKIASRGHESLLLQSVQSPGADAFFESFPPKTMRFMCTSRQRGSSSRFHDSIQSVVMKALGVAQNGKSKRYSSFRNKTFGMFAPAKSLTNVTGQNSQNII